MRRGPFVSREVAVSWQVVVFLLVPVLAGIIVFGVIVVVALRRARPEDVPGLVRDSSRGLHQFVRGRGRHTCDEEHVAPPKEES